MKSSNVSISFPGGLAVKNLPTMEETWVGKIPWRREQLPTPVFWPEEWTEKPGGLQSMGHKESDMTE